MPAYHNVEKRVFHHGEYVGWDSHGHRWIIRKFGRSEWSATKQTGGSGAICAQTLREISQRLAAM